ncbi:MAG: hypothetical protein QOG04_2046 [Actinomycetota bacterium]|nr:hypothetical protein [Actinomycetota bacterium]
MGRIPVSSECFGPPRRSSRKVREMNERSCGWMSGPKDASVKVSAAKWWLAISRDTLAKEYRRQTMSLRPAATCYRTPTFVSPLSDRSA